MFWKTYAVTFVRRPRSITADSLLQPRSVSEAIRRRMGSIIILSSTTSNLHQKLLHAPKAIAQLLLIAERVVIILLANTSSATTSAPITHGLATRSREAAPCFPPLAFPAALCSLANFSSLRTASSVRVQGGRASLDRVRHFGTLRRRCAGVSVNASIPPCTADRI